MNILSVMIDNEYYIVFLMYNINTVSVLLIMIGNIFTIVYKVIGFNLNQA